ncbi:MAG: type VI secretion system protein TssA [bacterium]
MSLPDFSSVLAPFDSDKPAGEPLEYTTKTRLDDNRKSVDPNDFDESDPQRPAEPKHADWQDIVSLCWETLETKTKDLNLVVRLLEGITRLDGYPGLAQGLVFLNAYIDACWDFTYPLVETEEDLELRAGPFDWLADPQRGARFPTTLRMLPIIDDGMNSYSVIDWNGSSNPNATATMEMMNKAIGAMSFEVAEANYDALRQSREQLYQTQNQLNDFMGPYAPSLSAIIQAVDECEKIAEGIYNRLKPRPVDSGDSESGTDGGSGDDTNQSFRADGQGWSAQNARQARDAIYARLSQLADTLIELEPHSPIPYLIRKAVDLGSLPYPQLMSRILENSEALESIRREFGLPQDEM